MTQLAADLVIAGRYRIVRMLGQGGMGAVYEVEHVHTGQRLALKVLTTHQGTSVERFKREARVASRIQSDHIVRVTDADVAPELDGKPFLVMELLDGSDLERATSDAPAAPAEVVEWLRQVARALGKAHEAGIVHRDLKPENLFLARREDGTPLVKILDFGIAKMAADAGPLTHSGQFLGTPHYMAPEQTDNHGGQVTERADLWALGLIAFRLLVGTSYWKPGSLAQLLAQILVEPMPPASARGATSGAAFDAWFARSCDREPENRFGSAVEQVEALASSLGLPRVERTSTPVATPRAVHEAPVKTLESAPTLDASSRELPAMRTRGGRTRWGLVAVAVAAAVGVGAFVVQGRNDGNPTTAANTGSAAPAAASVGATSTSTSTSMSTSVPLPTSVPGSPPASSLAPTASPALSLTPPPALAPSLAPTPAHALTLAPAHAPSPSPSSPPRSRPSPSASRDPLEGQY